MDTATTVAWTAVWVPASNTLTTTARFPIMPKLRPISMGRANDVVAMMSDRPITWWFDAEIERLEALSAELVAFEAAAIKKGAVVRCPELEIGAEFGIGAVAVFPNGWCADVELGANPYSKGLRLKYRSRVSDNWSTRQHHNTWRQALARTETGDDA